MITPTEPAGEIVAAVVVAFEPDEQLNETLLALVTQVQSIIVVDNSASVEARRRVEMACHTHGCCLIVNGRNLGISEALNAGVRAAYRDDATFVLTMDQDSTVMPGMVQELLRVLHEARSNGIEVGCVAASSVDAATGVSIAVPASESEWSELILAITSGSLVPMSVFMRCGLFRAEYFIDSVDHEFCLRLRQHGFHILRAHRAALRHRLGHPTIHRMLGRRFIPTNHSAFRRFYMARNVLWTARLFFFTETRTVTVLLLKLFKNAVLIAAFEADKRVKLTAIVAGLFKGVTTNPPVIQELS